MAASANCWLVSRPVYNADMDRRTNSSGLSEVHICGNCGSENVSFEPTPFDDEDGRRLVNVYRCRDCGEIYVPDFDEPA